MHISVCISQQSYSKQNWKSQWPNIGNATRWLVAKVFRAFRAFIFFGDRFGDDTRVFQTFLATMSGNYWRFIPFRFIIEKAIEKLKFLCIWCLTCKHLFDTNRNGTILFVGTFLDDKFLIQFKIWPFAYLCFQSARIFATVLVYHFARLSFAVSTKVFFSSS